MTLNIGLIDYGMGNIYSVKKAFQRINQSIILVKLPDDLNNCDALILPGVGSFDPAIENLKNTKLIPYIKNWAAEGKHLLGICLGLQLLFEYSEEGSKEGLGLIKGNVKKLPKYKKERIPHMGWAKLKKEEGCPLIESSADENWMYFVHSYSAIVSNKKNLAASANYGDLNISAIVWEDNIGACQFHPEKSGKAGQKILSNWINWIKKHP